MRFYLWLVAKAYKRLKKVSKYDDDVYVIGLWDIQLNNIADVIQQVGITEYIKIYLPDNGTYKWKYKFELYGVKWVGLEDREVI